jgi:hypothetical protein
VVLAEFFDLVKFPFIYMLLNSFFVLLFFDKKLDILVCHPSALSYFSLESVDTKNWDKHEDFLTRIEMP